MSIWFKASKLYLNLSKTKWKPFYSQKKKRDIANDLPILYINNFEIIRKPSSVTLNIIRYSEIDERKLFFL